MSFFNRRRFGETSAQREPLMSEQREHSIAFCMNDYSAVLN
jgi:hypothetical protein